MIEHIPYASAERMLSECFRVMKPGGVIQDRDAIIGFYFEYYFE